MHTVTYILTHNSPPQLAASFRSLQAADAEFFTGGSVIVMDQSTLDSARQANLELCERWGASFVPHANIGASGGRWACAQHFKASDADMMFYFEDDLVLSGAAPARCRFGFPNVVERLFRSSIAIMTHERLDYLKLTFHELHFDHSNNFITKRPARFNKLASLSGAAYLVGDVYFSNWPMLIRRSASAAIFSGPAVTEGAVATKVHAMVERGELSVGVLAAWPVRHLRLEVRPDCKDL